MKRHEERFAPDKLDEQFEQLIQEQEAGTSTPEQVVLQNLHSFHATRAEHEQQLLERVRLRLAASGASQQSTAEEKEVPFEAQPSLERNLLLLPALRRRGRRRFSTFLQSVAAIVLVGLLVSCFLTILHLAQRGTGTSASFTANWQLVSGPRLPAQANHLWGVSASRENDVWAVGESFDGSHRKTLIEHWDGQKWKVVTNPNPGLDPTLQSVAAIAPDDAWAVGETSLAQGNGMSAVLIEHWNGKQWSVVQAPNPGSKGSSLSKVVAISPNNVWAVGTSVDAGISKALIEHWDGKKWRVASSYSPASISVFLTGITAIAGNDIWVVGYLIPSSFSRQALVEHWDGRAWKIIDIPDLQTGNSQLFTVSATSSNDVWAVGSLADGSAGGPLIEHWDGKQWSISPVPEGLSNSFAGVMAVNDHDVWAIGSTNVMSGQPVLFVHWDGMRWSTVEVARASVQCQNELIDIAAVPQSNKLWAVGSYVTSSCNNLGDSPLLIQPLFELYTFLSA